MDFIHLFIYCCQDVARYYISTSLPLNHQLCIQESISDPFFFYQVGNTADYLLDRGLHRVHIVSLHFSPPPFYRQDSC